MRGLHINFSSSIKKTVMGHQNLRERQKKLTILYLKKGISHFI